MKCASILTIIFVLLKINDVVDFSWWWVFSPVIIVAIIFVLLTSIVGTISLWLEK